MDFAKFVSLITSQSLWFCSLEVLAREDPFEASFPKRNLAHTRIYTPADLPGELIPWVRGQMRDGRAFDEAKSARIFGSMIRGMRDLRKFYFVNCWHMFPTESAAMWHGYGKHDSAVAITSSVERMTRAFADQSLPIFCGIIDYIDFETALVDFDNAFNFALKKRLSFHSENEVRLLCWDVDLMQSGSGSTSKPPPSGRVVTCSLSDLIDEIWVSPTSPDWLTDTIHSVCRFAGLEARVRRSTILDQPLD